MYVVVSATNLTAQEAHAVTNAIGEAIVRKEIAANATFGVDYTKQKGEGKQVIVRLNPNAVSKQDKSEIQAQASEAISADIKLIIQ